MNYKLLIARGYQVAGFFMGVAGHFFAIGPPLRRTLQRKAAGRAQSRQLKFNIGGNIARFPFPLPVSRFRGLPGTPDRENSTEGSWPGLIAAAQIQHRRECRPFSRYRYPFP
ncbi:hypothetical protein [Chitinophaga caseinilytica]|uniref:hypothetical protein n=1 Tax=Chitinophaga caseinilytica TaxID=2267521 RepID=UPI003C2D081F